MNRTLEVQMTCGAVVRVHPMLTRVPEKEEKVKETEN